MSFIRRRILVIEDNSAFGELLVCAFERSDLPAFIVSNIASARESLESGGVSGILSNLNLSDGTGMEFLHELRERGDMTPFVLMTAYGDVETAVEAMKLGAADFLSKPFEIDTVVCLFQRILGQSPGAKRRISDTGLVSKNPLMIQLLKDAEKAARVDTSILIVGESGTGKELLARRIHEQSPRKKGPYIAVNCGAIPADLLESEFFGHEEGSFTGASHTRIGVFELASEGTLFLDEVAEMPLHLQVKLLRVLQEREIKRVGGTRTITVNPRIVSATNRELFQESEKGTFREDLYYRIAVISLRIPSLRERKEDIPILAQSFLQKFHHHGGSIGSPISDEAHQALIDYSWPGNVRELENKIERGLVLGGGVISPASLGLAGLDFDSLSSTIQTLGEISNAAVREAEVEHIRKAMLVAAGNKSKAAKALGVSYKTLLNKMKEYELNAP